MRYEHTPRPEVEHHHHIRDLIEGQDKRARERNEFRERQKTIDDRESIVRDAPAFCLCDFWCSDCAKDFKAQTFKEIMIDEVSDERYAFYRTKHWCGKWCIRYITDKHRDPYWFKSKAVRFDRATHRLAILQPFEEGYNLKYGKPR